MDADDVISTRYIEYLLRVCKENDSDLSYCGSYSFCRDEEITLLEIPKYEEIKKESYDKIYALQNCFPLWLQANVWGKLFRKRLFNHIRFTPGIVRAEDLEIIYFLVNEAERVSNIKHCKLYYYRDRPQSAMSIMTVDALQDFEVRMKVYDFFETIPNCDTTREKFAAQTMRIFLDFALLGKEQVRDYKYFRKGLQKHARELTQKMWKNHAKTKMEKVEIWLVAHSVQMWVCFRLLQYKIFKRQLYVE